MRLLFLLSMIVVLTGAIETWPWASLFVPALSPYVGIMSTLAGRTMTAVSDTNHWSVMALPPAVWIGLPVLVLVLFSKRWFCRYACPVGLCIDPLRRLRPSARTAFVRLPLVGRWIVLATAAGALLGCPLAIWLDSLAIFSGAFSLWHDPARVAGWAAAIGLLLIAISSALWPNAWCLRVCPLGATQELLSIGVRAVTGLRRKPIAKPVDSHGRAVRLSRRTVFALSTGAVAAAAGGGVAAWARASGSRRQAIRPPGAAREEEFPWLCVRCGNCLRACPEKILRPDLAPATLAGYLAPVVRFDQSYCKEDCRLCTQVCPSGAIAPLSLEAKPSQPMGLAKVDMSLCLLSPENGERECAICRNACPYQAIRLEFDYDTYVTSPRVDPQLCPGCGACEVACPGTNATKETESAAGIRLQKAIYVVPHAPENPARSIQRTAAQGSVATPRQRSG